MNPTYHSAMVIVPGDYSFGEGVQSPRQSSEGRDVLKIAGGRDRMHEEPPGENGVLEDARGCGDT